MKISGATIVLVPAANPNQFKKTKQNWFYERYCFKFEFFAAFCASIATTTENMYGMYVYMYGMYGPTPNGTN